jgi:hypothetical protein
VNKPAVSHKKEGSNNACHREGVYARGDLREVPIRTICHKNATSDLKILLAMTMVVWTGNSWYNFLYKISKPPAIFYGI